MPQQWGDPINSVGVPPEAYEGLTPDERIALARQITIAFAPNKQSTLEGDTHV